jgi:D-tyrosyl-tRNA(Tyr) deacylase
VRTVVQRVSSARVTIGGEVTAAIGPGLLVLLGVRKGDTEADVTWLVHKIAALRIFEDGEGRMNRSLLDVNAAGAAPLGPTGAAAGEAPRQLLVVSQFTLLASTRRGTRPSFNDAAPPEVAVPLYDSFIRQATVALGRPVATGTFGARMEVALVNDGPVTLVLDSHTRE